MRARLSAIIIALILLSSCVYTWRGDISSLDRMGGPGKAVITLDAAALKKSGASALLPDNELVSRLDRVSVELTPTSDEYPLEFDGWEVTGTANGLLSSTEVGTLLIWDPQFVRADGSPRHYTSRSLGLSAGVPEDGIVLFTSDDYTAAHSRLFRGHDGFIPAETLSLMKTALASLYIDSPVTLPPLGFDIPKETIAKIENLLLLLGDGDDAFMLSGEIRMVDEDSARTLCTLLRNLLVQEIRRNGERLDVKALSGIFTYEGSLLRISGYRLSYDKVSQLLTKEL